MFASERNHIVDNLLADFANELTESDDWITSLIAESRCVMWHCDDYSDVKTWSENENAIGFSASLHFGSDQDDDYYSPLDEIRARMEGVVTLDNGEWVVSHYEIHEADYDLDPDDFESNYKDAVLSNENYFETFSNEVERLGRLSDIELEMEDLMKTLRRQIFIGIITSLETFLSDAFIHKVISTPELLESFFANFKFPEEKIFKRELYEIAINGSLDELAKNEMVRVIYHNLPKVAEMYRSVLKIDFPDYVNLADAVDTRHDLVHRNGRRKDGTDRVIGKDTIDDLLKAVTEFVKSINDSLNGRSPWDDHSLDDLLF